jgi:hypothetical protein
MGPMMPSGGYNMPIQPMPQQVNSTAVPDLQQAVVLLRESLYPSQREWAADKLSSCKWQSHPHVVQVLVASLRDDPAATVRAACIRTLAKMDANLVPVVSALEALKSDPDEIVRREVERALTSLGASQSAPVGGRPTVLPASAVTPASR